MKKIIKYLFYLFVISAVLSGIIEAIKKEPAEQDSGNEEIVERESGKKEDVKDKKSKPQEKYTAISTITDINGKWKYGDDVILFDSYRRVVQFNSGPEMKMDFIDATNKPDYPNQEFYVYGTIGTTKVFRTRVLINEDKSVIYLDRVDGNTPHYYKKVKELAKEASASVKTKALSKNEQLQIIADSILQTIPITSYQALFNDIAMNEDRVLEIAQKMHPDDFMAEREAQLSLEEQYFKRWAKAKFDWYEGLDFPEDEKYSILSKVRAKISGIGVRNGWLNEYDRK
jgi:hypothetical protein